MDNITPTPAGDDTAAGESTHTATADTGTTGTHDTGAPHGVAAPGGTTRPEDRRWRRPRTGRIVGGVAAGVARHTDLEPWMVRTLFVLTSFAGGFGIVAYLAAWLIMPEEGTTEAVADQLGRNRSATQAIGIGLMGLAALIVIGATGLISSPLLFAAALVVAGVALVRPSST